MLSLMISSSILGYTYHKMYKFRIKKAIVYSILTVLGYSVLLYYIFDPSKRVSSIVYLILRLLSMTVLVIFYFKLGKVKKVILKLSKDKKKVLSQKTNKIKVAKEKQLILTLLPLIFLSSGTVDLLYRIFGA